MTVISFSKGSADTIGEITKELKRANELKEAELRLKYGNETYANAMRKVWWG